MKGKYKTHLSEVSDLSDVSDVADDVNNYELDVKTIVESIFGNSSSAIAEVILVIETYDGSLLNKYLRL